MLEVVNELFTHMSKQASKRRPVAAGIPSLPFQALRASFPEGKPTHVRFEAHVGLTDQRNLGQLTQSA